MGDRISLEELLEAQLVMEYAKLATKEQAKNAAFQVGLAKIHWYLGMTIPF